MQSSGEQSPARYQSPKTEKPNDFVEAGGYSESFGDRAWIIYVDHARKWGHERGRYPNI